jgi:hypothetical protein
MREARGQTPVSVAFRFIYALPCCDKSWYANIDLQALMRGGSIYRCDALQAFKDGEVRFLICTDVGARGLDISGLPYVINMTLPDRAEDYIHRVGRVGSPAVHLIFQPQASKSEPCSRTGFCRHSGPLCLPRLLIAAYGPAS